MTNIEALVKKHMNESDWYNFPEESLREALTEQAETHAIELRAYEATVQNLEGRIRQLEAQVVPVGLKVSVDVGTGEHDSFNRVFATVTGQQDDGQGGVILLCEEESRNFEQSVPVVGEPDCYDAGLLGDFGGGNVEWWQDYIRAELARAHDFYASQWPSAIPAAELATLRDKAAMADELQKRAERMQKALSDIAEWTDRYTTPGHPVSTIARAAIAQGKGE